MKYFILACLLFASALAQTDVTAEPGTGMAPGGFSGGFPGGAPMPMPGMAMAGNCEMFLQPAMCKAHFPMCQWVFDEDMYACMESKEVESSKGFWASQNMPGAPQMNPMAAAVVGASEGDIPAMLPPIMAGGMPGPVMPGPIMSGPEAPPAEPIPAMAGPSGPGFGMGPSPAMLPPMMLPCEAILEPAPCARAPMCTWIFDDSRMQCQETKEVENNKAFWISQQGQMMPNGPMPGMAMGGGMPGVGGGMPGPMPGPMPGVGGPMGPGMMMTECGNILQPTACRSMFPRCQWVLDETEWACMEAKEVESGKGFWTMDNAVQGGLFPGPGRGFPGAGGVAQTTGEPSFETVPGAVLKRATIQAQDVQPSNHNNAVLLGATVSGFALGIILAFVGLHFRKKTQPKFDTILLDEGGVIRQV